MLSVSKVLPTGLTLVSLALGNNIDLYTGCNPTQKSQIQTGYKDMLSLTDWLSPFLGHDELFAPLSASLPVRYFGADTTRGSDAAKRVQGVFDNARNWYAWPIFDWIGGKRIHVSCTDTYNICNGKVGGYAKNLESGPLITFCPPYFDDFAFPSLAARKTYLDANPNNQKNIKSYGTKGQVFLHEMVHLEVISGKPHIPDFQRDTGAGTSLPTYGPYLCEKLAGKNGINARNNSDNYALYASAYWFQYYYGTPDVPTSSNGFSAEDSSTFDTNDVPYDGTMSFVLDDGSDSTPGPDINYGDSGYFPDTGEIEQVMSLATASFTNKPSNLAAWPVQSSLGSAPTQAAGQPIAAPACWDNNVASIPPTMVTNSGNVDPNTLLYSLRQQICSDDCSTPAGVPNGVTAITQDDSQTDCEIAVGVSSSVEAYMYRTYPAIGVQWQECWDSTQDIINNCIKGGPNKGWWNGDHVYQFYELGFRPLNDPSAKHTTPITSWLSTPAPTPTPSSSPTAGYSCDNDCRGYVPDQQWCVDNCAYCFNANNVC